jgi:hypothetical protein
MATQAVQDFSAQLEGVDRGKGCLRFKRLDSVPTETIKKLLVHAKDTRERECKTKT